jgi:hypothetical protein
MQHQSEMSHQVRMAVLGDFGLAWAQRILWAVCIGVYLTVFIGGIQAGGAELITVGRAAGFTLVAAVLGKMALNLLAKASLPIAPGPMANQDGHFGSLGMLSLSANVPQPQEEADAAVTGER